MSRYCENPDCGKRLVRKSFVGRDGYTRKEAKVKFNARKYCDNTCRHKGVILNRPLEIVIENAPFLTFCFSAPFGGGRFNR